MREFCTNGAWVPEVGGFTAEGAERGEDGRTRSTGGRTWYWVLGARCWGNDPHPRIEYGAGSSPLPERERGRGDFHALGGLHVHIEAQVDFGGGNAAFDAPILGRTLSQQDFDLVAGYAEGFEVLDYSLVEGFLRLKGAAGDQVDFDEGVPLALFGGLGEAVGFMDDKANGLVPFGDIEGLASWRRGQRRLWRTLRSGCSVGVLLWLRLAWGHSLVG